MNLKRIQKDALYSLYTNNPFAIVKHSEHVCLTNLCCIWVLKRNECYLNVESFDVIDRHDILDHYGTCPLKLTDDLKVVQRGTVRRLHGEDFDVYVNVLFLNYFELNKCTFAGKSERLPVYVFESGELRGVLFPVRVEG